MAKQILIVDDDVELCSEIAEILRDEGYSVDIASDGIQGYEHIKNNAYDIILLDFKMPGLNGIELLEKVKAYSHKSKIFLISGRPHLDKFIDEENLNTLITGVFPKPFDVEMLLARIKE